jgi:hypothetical protein
MSGTDVRAFWAWARAKAVLSGQVQYRQQRQRGPQGNKNRRWVRERVIERV